MRGYEEVVVINGSNINQPSASHTVVCIRLAGGGGGRGRRLNNDFQRHSDSGGPQIPAPCQSCSMRLGRPCYLGRWVGGSQPRGRAGVA